MGFDRPVSPPRSDAVNANRSAQLRSAGKCPFRRASTSTASSCCHKCTGIDRWARSRPTKLRSRSGGRRRSTTEPPYRGRSARRARCSAKHWLGSSRRAGGHRLAFPEKHHHRTPDLLARTSRRWNPASSPPGSRDRNRSRSSPPTRLYRTRAPKRNSPTRSSHR